MNSSESRGAKFPVEGVSYETGVEGVFVGGWSRQASHGLVGYARKDGINAAKSVLQYLAAKAPAGEACRRCRNGFERLNKQR